MSQGVKGQAYRVPWGQGIGLQVTGSWGVKEQAYSVPGGQGVGLQGPRRSRGMPRGSQGVQGQAQGIPGVQGVGLQGCRGSRGRPAGSRGVKEQAYRAPRGQGVGLQKRNTCPLGTFLETFTFTQICSFILLPTIGKITSSLSAFMGEEKYFFLDQKEILSFCCPLGTLQFCLIGSIGLNQVQ